MPSFSQRSMERLLTCHEDLQGVLSEAIKITDFSVICGNRGEEEQNLAYESGNSKLKYPDSKHNKFPSEAVDIVPHPLNWDDTESFAYMAGVVIAIARTRNVDLIWGGEWKMRDMPHFELKGG